MKKLNGMDWISLVLVIVGALNWGLVGLFEFNLVTSIFGDMTLLSRTVYVLVGLAGLYLAYDAMYLGRKETTTRSTESPRPVT